METIKEMMSETCNRLSEKNDPRPTLARVGRGAPGGLGTAGVAFPARHSGANRAGKIGSRNRARALCRTERRARRIVLPAERRAHPSGAAALEAFVERIEFLLRHVRQRFRAHLILQAALRLDPTLDSDFAAAWPRWIVSIRSVAAARPVSPLSLRKPRAFASA